MSHIANNIVAQQKALNEVFTGNRYRIDVFQRDYRWKRNQIDELISDLSSSFLNCYKQEHTQADVEGYDSYYMGPIVLCQEDGYLSVVDGQQRLTTFTLLFIFIKHKLRELVLEETEEYFNMEDYLYVKRGGRKTFVMDVPQRKDVLQRLCDGGVQGIDMDISEESEEDRESNINLVNGYDDILHLFPEQIQKRDILPLFIEWLLFKVIVVEIKAYDKDNAYTIFETMNDRGLSLNPTEILKAHILAKIIDEDKREEMNDLWKKRVAEINYVGGTEGDLAFFRAWFRSKYAETFKKTLSGGDLEDFEMIGSKFHTWFKSNQKKLHLTKSDDYYYFVKGDFEFFSSEYMEILRLCQGGPDKIAEDFYITACYPMADSLKMPLMLAPILATDATGVIYDKMRAVNRYIDLFINRRSLWGKSIDQASIRRRVFALIKTIRNNSFSELVDNLYQDIVVDPKEGESLLFANNSMSQGYTHYALARIWKHLDANLDFSSLLRTRRNTSYVLTHIISDEEWKNLGYDTMSNPYWKLANYCLCPRWSIAKLPLNSTERLAWLIRSGYIPEMKGIDVYMISNLVAFFEIRHNRIEAIVNQIWSVDSLIGMK